MKDTQFSRKLDSNGRLVIPIRLREQLGLVAGETYTFYTHEHEGKTYLCVECGDFESDVQKAIKLLNENGLQVTKKQD